MSSGRRASREAARVIDLDNHRRARRRQGVSDPQFPRALAGWIATHGDLLDVLIALRELGDCGRKAIEAISREREVATVKESWELWEVLTEGDGLDPEVELLRTISPSALAQATHALWGPRWDLENIGELVEPPFPRA